MAFWAVSAAFGLMSGYQQGQEYRKAGQQALVEARLQAAEIRSQKNDVSILATEQHADRMQQFANLVSTNNAYAAYMGRQDRSIQALLRREQAKYGRDVDRIRSQEAREKASLEKQAQATVERGRAQNKQYRSAARSSMFNAVASAVTMSVAGSSGGTSSSSTKAVTTTPGNTGTGAKVTVAPLGEL